MRGRVAGGLPGGYIPGLPRVGKGLSLRALLLSLPLSVVSPRQPPGQRHTVHTESLRLNNILCTDARKRPALGVGCLLTGQRAGCWGWRVDRSGEGLQELGSSVLAAIASGYGDNAALSGSAPAVAVAGRVSLGFSLHVGGHRVGAPDRATTKVSPQEAAWPV